MSSFANNAVERRALRIWVPEKWLGDKEFVAEWPMLTFRDSATRVPLVLDLLNSKYYNDTRNGRALRLLEGVCHNELNVLPLRGPKALLAADGVGESAGVGGSGGLST
jgi:hypothetical protein